MLILVLNCGSSSLKFQLIDAATHRRWARGGVERIGAVSAIATLQVDANGVEVSERHGLTAPDHDRALAYVLEFLLDDARSPIREHADIAAVGHRVVHGGERFSNSVLIDAAVMESISESFDLAPLHNPANLKGIQAAMGALPATSHVAVFDTAFHQTLPRHAYLYAVPSRLHRKHKIRRYGFHGPSHYYVSRRLYELSGLAPSHSRVITCHLGNGCSMAAIADGVSVDTSMGLTPLAGLVMGTRCGDIDPALVFELIEKEELSLAEVHAQLHRYSGLLGLSGFSSDMRDIVLEAESGDLRCAEAIDVFCYRAKAYLGQYYAVLNGCDAVVFTAGIGENSALIRGRICDDLHHLGIVLDDERNRSTVGKEGRISAAAGSVQVWVIPTNEELVIALDAMRIVQQAAAC